MKQLLQKLKKNWILVWLIVAAIAFSSFIGYAAYTEVSSVKRVVSTAASPGDPFSSNCLKVATNYHRMTAETTVFPVSVCNFDQNFPEKYCSTEINYILTAKLQVKINNAYKDMSEVKSELDELSAKETKTEEDEKKIDLYTEYVNKVSNYYSIQKTADDKREGLDSSPIFFSSTNDYTVTYVTEATGETPAEYQKLKEKRSSTDIFTVTINNIDLDENGEPRFFVYITAEPITGANYTLSGRLYRTNDRTDAEAKWDGTISDSESNSRSYDFYNYVITGSGEGTLDILWNENQIYVNKFFLIENNLEEPTDQIATSDPKYGTEPAAGTEAHDNWIENRVGWKKVSLEVDSINKTNRYEIQLYKTDNFTGDPSSYIKCYFSQAEEAQEQEGE